MGVRAAVVGASGYAGGELIRLIDGHPDLEVGTLVAAAHAGETLGGVHPALVTLADRPMLAAAETDLAADDLIFLALPHGASAAVVATLPETSTVVDLGADFRIRDAAAWQRWYGGEHAGSWPYGLPELPGARDVLTGARRIANPGCYATAITLALAPLLTAELVEPGDIVVVAASGASGAGRSASQRLLGSEVMGDLTPYKLAGAHQHLAELRQSLSAVAGSTVTMSLTPVLSPMPRGILATCTARARRPVTRDDVTVAFAGYADEPFVHLLPEGRWPHTAATVGSNACQLQVDVDTETGRVIVVAAIDNLGKGAAGQAVQNANLALGLPETMGLSRHGIAP